MGIQDIWHKHSLIFALNIRLLSPQIPANLMSFEWEQTLPSETCCAKPICLGSKYYVIEHSGIAWCPLTQPNIRSFFGTASVELHTSSAPRLWKTWVRLHICFSVLSLSFLVYCHCYAARNVSKHCFSFVGVFFCLSEKRHQCRDVSQLRLLQCFSHEKLKKTPCCLLKLLL